MRVSVVVPAYNAAATLPRCLEALRRQTRPPDEVIVVDDGSKDDTAAVAAAYGVQVFRQRHQGPAAARNLGVEKTSGDIVLFTDADCEPAPDWIAEMVHPFSDSVVAGVKGAYRTRQQGVVARLAQWEFQERYDRLRRYNTIDFIDSYAAAFRTQVFRRIGGFDPAFHKANNEDVDLSYRLAGAGYKLVFNPQAIVYHVHPASWKAYWCLKVKRGYWRMMVYRLHPHKALHDSYTPQLLKVQVGLMLICALLVFLTPFQSGLLVGAALSLVCLLLSAMPLALKVAGKDGRLACWVPLFVLVRATAFAVGVTIGAIAMWAFRPSLLGVPDSREIAGEHT